jgi:hypothetical protein
MPRLTRHAPVLALIALASACAEDGDGLLGPSPIVPVDVVSDTAPPPPEDISEPPDVPAAAARLTYAAGQVDAAGNPCTTSCFLRATAGGRLTVAVRYVDGEGRPLAERGIFFDPGDAPAGFLALGAFSVFTDADGVASVEVRSQGLAGSATITASVDGSAGAGVAPLTFALTFDVAPQPDLIVSFQHFGSAAIQGFTVRGWLLGPDSAPACAAVYPDAPPARAPDLTVGPFQAGAPAVIDALPGLATVNTQRWTFQVLGNGPIGPVASGCADAVTAIEGSTATVAIPVLDLPLNFRGTQQVQTRVDALSGGTDTTVGALLATLADLFTAPGGLIIRWACGGDPDGTLGTVCGFLVNDDGELSITGAVIAGYADGALLGLLSDAIGSNNQQAARIVSELLRDLRFLSELELASEPAEPLAGFDGARFGTDAVLETWVSVRFRWKFDPACKNTPDPEDCGWTTIPMEDIYGFRPTARPGVGVDFDQDLHVDRHAVPDLTFGPLISAIVELRLLALMFQAENLRDVGSWEDLIGVLLGDRACLDNGDCCDLFAERIYDDVPYWVYLLTPAACEAAIPIVANVIRDRFAALDGALNLGTPADAACPAHDGDGDRWVDGYGTSFRACLWDLDFATDSGPYTMTNSWRSTTR